MNINPTQLLSYNKYSRQQGTLIANWFQQRELRDNTGEGRNLKQTHFPKKHQDLLLKDPDQVAKYVANKKYLNTDERINGHKKPLKMTTENYLQLNLTSYGKSKNEAQSLPKVGKRHLLLQKQFMDTIKGQLLQKQQQQQQQRRQRQFQTTFNTYYHPKVYLYQKDVQTHLVGRRRMKDMDGNPIPYQRKDQDLLTDNNFYQRKQITQDKILEKILPKDQSYLVQQPITFWRQKAYDGCFYNSKQSQVPKDEFKRNNEFLKTFHHYTHEKC